jgi:energy-coupling factor transporter ATP-binding protein EcfA2
MINKLYLEGFKAFFGEAEIELAPLTVLAGKNSSGKSSITGALAALIQTEEAGYRPEPGLNTHGPWARLGRASEVPHKLRRGENARRFALGIEISGELQLTDGAKWPYVATLRLEYATEERDVFPYFAPLERVTIIVQQPGEKQDILHIESTRPKEGEPRKYSTHWEGRGDLPREVPVRGNCWVGINESVFAVNNSIMPTLAAFEPSILLATQAPDIYKKAKMDTVRDFQTALKRLTDALETNDLLHRKIEDVILDFANEFPRMLAEIDKDAKPLTSQARDVISKYLHIALAADALRKMHIALDPNRHQILSAYRIPPMDLYVPRPDFGPRLGLFGEHVGQAIDELRERDSDIPGPLPGVSVPRRGLTLLNEWWAYLFDLPTLRVESQSIGRLGHELSVVTPEAEDLKLYQVGAGLSQTLPIIAAVILSKTGEQLIIDTPESHLHPAAQHRLAELLVTATAAGRRLLIETHSDHLVNGLCLAVKRKRLLSTDLCIHFISHDDQGSSVQKITVDDDGRVQEWPLGFMDQSSQDLTALLG